MRGSAARAPGLSHGLLRQSGSVEKVIHHVVAGDAGEGQSSVRVSWKSRCSLARS
jgi:hypothetical protein